MKDYNFLRVESYYKSKIIGLRANKETARMILKDMDYQEFSRDEFFYLLTLINMNWNGKE